MPVNRSPEREQLKEQLYRRFSRRGRLYRCYRRIGRSLLWLLFIQIVAAVKRWFDVTVALILSVVFSPLWLPIVIWMARQGQVLHPQVKLGRWGARFSEYRFAFPPHRTGRWLTMLKLDRWPLVLNILKGDMSWIGPRAVRPGKISLNEHRARKRFSVRPGVICLWWIRRRGNIAFDSEIEVDGEYVDGQSFIGDLGIALRAIPAILYGDGVPTAPDHIRLLGIPIANVTMEDAVNEIIIGLDEPQPRQICFVNADCANIAYHDDNYRQVLIQAGQVFADGIGIKLAGKLLGRDIKQNVNGTDLFPRLCQALNGTDHSLFLLGAKPGVAQDVANWISTHYPQVKVSGWHHGYFDAIGQPQVLEMIAASGVALLLVAFGSPRQDLWIAKHLNQCSVKVAIGVGGLFDFYSGRMSRAPLWMREIGMEWFYRFCQEPGRLWKRYLIGNAVFLLRVLKEKWLL